MRKRTLIVMLLVITCYVKADVRNIQTINDGWRFMIGSPHEARTENFDDSAWAIVNIPHTWNNLDGDDEVPGYYRGPAWYRKSVFVDKNQREKHVVISFEGANQEVQVYVNGFFAGMHKGGYTRFNFDISKLLHYGAENIFAIRVDNTYNPNIPPLSADFTFYGGVYRDVYLQFSNQVHFATNNYATSGVYIRTPRVSKKEAIIEITSLVSNDTDKGVNLMVENLILDGKGKEVKRMSSDIKLTPGLTAMNIQKNIKMELPLLWDIDNPHRYLVYTRIYNKEDKFLLDEVINPMGLRWFKFDSEQGFFLNGKHRKLKGTNRHQDYYQKGNALRDEMHVRDILLLKQMGGNFLRVSHYPQDPIVMEMCDKLGIVTSVEIPVVNAITETQEFIDNAVNMAKEMVCQNFNHPSIMIWGYMNEILLRKPYKDSERLKQYYLDVEKAALALENTIRKEDPSRYTMMAYHNSPKSYEAAKLTSIPMILGWNLYQGWYEPDMNEFQHLLDRAHNTYKGKSLIVTEYGPGVDPRLHCFDSERFDFSQEYGIIYHKHYLKEMMKRPFLTGFSMWNLNDFYSESRVDAVPHVNNKGVTGLDRERKDTYLFYEASLNKKPILLIGNREWKTRGGVVNEGGNSCKQCLPVFSNLTEVELVVNGRSIGTQHCKENIAQFEVPFVNGVNSIEAIGKKGEMKIRDAVYINFKLIPSDLKSEIVPFTEMNVMLGSNRYFEDREAEMIWIPEKEYKPGSWGYVGGEPYRRKTGFGTMIGSEIDIIGTTNHPIFQTQRTGLESFKADVPDGKYSIYLYWAELDSNKKKESLVYNLGVDSSESKLGNRYFGVSINGDSMLENLNIAKEYGYGRAVIKKFVVTVKNGQGLQINFQKQEGETILNAIRIYRNY